MTAVLWGKTHSYEEGFYRSLSLWSAQINGEPHQEIPALYHQSLNDSAQGEVPTLGLNVSLVHMELLLGKLLFVLLFVLFNNVEIRYSRS